MPFLLEPNDDVTELLRLQLLDRGHVLHRASTIEGAIQHLAGCHHDAVVVGGDLAPTAWRWLYGVLPDEARVTLWSSHPGATIPQPPSSRSITAELLLGMPTIASIVQRLLPRGEARGDEGIA